MFIYIIMFGLGDSSLLALMIVAIIGVMILGDSDSADDKKINYVPGIRKSINVLIRINIELAMEEGIEFYVSSNNVILSPGNKDGYILPKYFLEITNF